MTEPINTGDVKAAFLEAPSRAVKDISIETARGPMTLVIRKPTGEGLLKLQESWKKRNLADVDGKPASTEAALAMNRELLARTLYLPGSIRPFFTPDELVDVAWVDEATESVLSVINTGRALESAKGN